MKGKIFKVIGIVLVAILAFVGIVIGVMAIQGKFKTPVVYPNELIFETNNFVVVNDDTLDNVHLHSFTLTGRNGNKTVNRKTCYLKFVDYLNGESIYGEELITLCDANKESLPVTENGYQVNCNEPIYYTFKQMGSNPVHYSRQNFGKVVLEAYSENGMVKSNQLVFYVDKAVEQIRLKDVDNYATETDAFTHKEFGTQTETIQLGNYIDFDYEILPNYSLRPYTDRLDGKTIELYYDNLISSNDYLQIDPATLTQNDDLSIQDGNGKIYYVDGKLRFEPVSSGHFSFIYAIFDSYEAQQNCPTTEFLRERVQNYMVYTVLDVNVISETAETVEIENNSRISLKLYDNTALYLNANQPAADNNLGLTINEGKTSALFDVLEFNTNQNRFWANNLTFASENNSLNLKGGEDANYRITNNNIVVDGKSYLVTYCVPEISIDGFKAIEKITLDNEDYYCKNGVALLGGNELKMLRAGSFLEFFDYDEINETYTKSALDYTATRIEGTSGANSNFNLLIKNKPQLEHNHSLKLMVLMVRNDGKLVYDCVDVNISTTLFAPDGTNVQQNVQLNITYPNNIANFGEVNFEDIVTLSGTYSAGVLVVPQNDVGYSVEVIPELTYSYNGQTYVLVGAKGENGEFKNVVKAKNMVGSSTTNAYLLLLKNAYQQTAEDFVNAKLESSINFDASEIANIYLDTAIIIQNNYELTNNLTYNFNESSAYEAGEEDKDNYIIFKDNCYYILEYTTNHTLTIFSPNASMLANIFDKISLNNFACYINGARCQDAITISNISLDEHGNLLINFSANSYSLLNGEKFVLGLTYNGTNYYSPSLCIDDCDPDQITFTLNNLSLALPTDSTAEAPTIEVEITGINQDGNFTFSYSYNGTSIENISNIFNSVYNKGANVNFVPTPAYSNEMLKYSFEYRSLEEAILKLTQTDGAYSLEILKIGQCKVLVDLKSQVSLGESSISEITELVGYINFNITTDENAFSFELENGNTNITTTANEINLADYLIYKHNQDALTDAKYFTISNVLCGNTSYRVQETDGQFKILDRFDVEVVTISKDNGWKIVRNEAFTYANINLSFNVGVATSSETLKVEIYFSNAITIDLNSAYDATIYENTNVKLMEKVNASAEFATNALFRIRELEQTSNNYIIKYNFGEDADETTANETICLKECGIYTFKIYSSTDTLKSDDDKLLTSYNVQVLPNIVFSADSNQQAKLQALESDSEYLLTENLTIKQYNISKTYGNDLNAIYADTDLVDFANYKDLNFVTDETESNKYETILSFVNLNVASLDDVKFSTLWLTDLDEQIDQIVKISYKTTTFDLPVKITNKYVNYAQYANDPFTVPSKAETSAPISFTEGTWVLNSVIAEGYKFNFNIVGDKFTLDQDLSEKVNAILTFEFVLDGGVDSGKKLTYTNANNLNGNARNLTIVLTPYLPEPKSEVKAYSATSFDIVKDIFDVYTASGITSITIEKSANGELYNLISETNEIVYNFAIPANTTITFKEINGNTKDITITYHIEYDNSDVSYNHEYVLTILNRQIIGLKYPYADYGEGADVIGFKVINNDADTYNFLQEHLTMTAYEIVNVGQTITFADNSRVKITDRTNSAVLTNQIKSVELVAYTGNISNLVEISQTEQNTFEVKFIAATNANMLFKITTNSNNFDFYFVKLYNQTLNNNYKDINSTNSWKFSLQAIGEKFYSTNKILNQTFDTNLLSTEFNLQNITPTTDNFKLYLLEATLLGGTANAYDALGLTQFSLLNNETLFALTQFATLKIALIYNGTGDMSEIYLGNIIVYSQSSAKITNTNENVTDLITDIQNGEYSATWVPSWDKYFTNPFNVSDSMPTLTIISSSVNAGFKVENNSIYLQDDEKNQPIISISGTSITREKYLTIDLSFVVEYAYEIDGETLYLYIHFTMPAVNPPTDTFETEIRYSTRSQQFENSVTINLGEYKGAIELQVGDKKVSAEDLSSEIANIVEASYADGTLTLSFKLLPNAYRVEFKILYSDLANAERWRDVSIAVDSAVYINFPTNSEGSSAEPLGAEKTAEGNAIYLREDASKIEITKDGKTYSVGGLKITTNEEAKLELTFNTNTNFVVTQLTGNILNLSETQAINFAHNAKTDDVIVEIAIKIKTMGGASYTDQNNNDIVTTLYVKVPRTYAGLVATYLIKGAEHENVSSSTTIENIRNNLFKKAEDADQKDILDNDIYNASKVAIIGLDGNQPVFVENGFTSMGFLNKSNANYIDISIDSSSINNLIPSGNNDHNLPFQQVSNNTLTHIVLSNNAGVQNVNYYYQVLEEFKLSDNETEKFTDAIIPQAEYLSKTSKDDTNVQKVDFSFVINKKSNSDTTFSTDELTIAKLFDGRNNAIYLKSATETVYRDALSSSTRDFNFETNEFSYNLKFGSKYTLTLTRTANKDIKIKLTDTTTANPDEKLNFELTLVGNGGEIKLSLNFYNCTISDIGGEEITAGSSKTIVLKENVTSNSKNNNSVFDDVTFEYQSEGSYFYYQNNRNLNLQADNDYFTLTSIESGNVNISVKSLSSNADIYLIFKVMLDGKQIGFIHVSITAECKLEFKINGSQTITGPTATQNDVYYLWLQSPSNVNGNFKNIKLFDYNDSTSTYNTYQANGVVYNSGLNISLYNGSNKLDAESVSITAVDQNDMLVAQDHYSIVKESNVINLKFKKDFSGIIILKLSVSTLHGYFVRYISLNVFGYIKLEYVNGRDQNSYIYPSSNSFDSNTSVQLINSYAGLNSVGLKISTTEMDSAQQYKNVSAKVEYAIVEHNTTKFDVASAFAGSTSKNTISLSPSTESNSFSLSTKLPIVPMTGKNYVVIYKLSLSYLNQETDAYYLAYIVRNTISITSNNAQINVDNDLEGNSSLRLFKYYITYTTTDNKNYIVYSKSDALHLVDVENSTDYTSTDESDQLTFTHDGNTIIISSAQSENPNLTIGGENKKATRKIVSAQGRGEKYLAYSLAYKSIIDFKNLIGELYVRIDASENSGFAETIREGETKYLYYQLTYLSSNSGTDYGVFGIDLTKPYLSKELNNQQNMPKFFNNEFNGTINLMSNKSHDVILSSSLNLISDYTLSAKGLTLNEIFGQNLDDDHNYSIIGVGSSPVTTWVKSATASSSAGENTGESVTYMNTNYPIYKATWSRTTSSGIYNLSKEFYYINANSLITVNYSSGESNSFIVAMENFKDSVFSASNKILQYTNSNYELKSESLNATLSGVSLVEVLEDDITSDYITQNDGNITVSWASLVKYKNLHPDKKFLTVTCNLVYSESINLKITINFKLPDNETISVENLTKDLGSETMELELTNSSKNYNLTIPTLIDDKINYVELTSTNAVNASLAELQTNYSTISNTSTSDESETVSATIKILLNVDSIKAYFNSNNVQYLTINYILTINGQSVNIDVCVKKPAA